MEERTQITLDFTKCKRYHELYGEMRTKMEWDDFYGENLDALWDILTAMPYKGNDFVILRPRQYHNIPHGHDDNFTKYVDKVCYIFERAQMQRYVDLTVQVIYTEE